MIYTHSGPFHADDVIAVAALRLFSLAPVYRTRSLPKLERAIADRGDYVVDVGGDYHALTHNFDHHQWQWKKGEGEIRPNGIPYAAAGLVWREHGVRAIDACMAGNEPPYADRAAIAGEVDRLVMAPVDAADVGFDLDHINASIYEDVAPLTVSRMISAFNPPVDPANTATDFDNAFMVAVAWAKAYLERVILQTAAKFRGEYEVRRVVEAHVAAVDAGYPADAATRPSVLVLPNFYPWQDIVIADPRCRDLHYVVYPQVETGFMVQCVPTSPGGFGMRKALPEAWASLRDGDFQEVSGVEDASFCHPNRFICGARSFEGALALARLAADA